MQVSQEKRRKRANYKPRKTKISYRVGKQKSLEKLKVANERRNGTGRRKNDDKAINKTENIHLQRFLACNRRRASADEAVSAEEFSKTA